MNERKGRLNTLDAVALTVGTMVGAGIFSILSLTVKSAGQLATLAWVAVVVLSLPMALTFSDLVGVLSESGGPYIYLQRRVGTRIGLWTAWLFLVSAAGATEALLMALARMLRELHVAQAMVWAAVIGMALALVVARGIHVGVRVQRGLTLATIALLLLCVVAGFGFGPSAHLASASTANAAVKPTGHPVQAVLSVLQATFFAFWTYSGWEAVAVPSGSYAGPRPLARGMLIGSLLVGGLYILVAAAALHALPANVIVRYTNPLVLVGQRWSPLVGQVVGWGAVVVVIGSLLSWFIATCTLVQSLIHNGLVAAPRALREHSGEYHPALPWLLAAALIALAQLPLFAAAVAASSLTALIAYAVVFWTVMRDRNAAWEGLLGGARRRRIAAGLSLLVTAALLLASGWHHLWPTLLLCLLGAGLVLHRSRTPA